MVLVENHTGFLHKYCGVFKSRALDKMCCNVLIRYIVISYIR